MIRKVGEWGEIREGRQNPQLNYPLNVQCVLVDTRNVQGFVLNCKLMFVRFSVRACAAAS